MVQHLLACGWVGLKAPTMAGNLFSLRASVELGRDVAMSEACQCRDSRSRRSTNARHRADCIIDSGTRTVHVPSPARPRSPVTGPLVVFVLAALCAGGMVWALERQEHAQQRTQVADMAGDHVQALQRAIELALSANNALVALVRQGKGQVTQFEEIGTQMLPFYPGIAARATKPPSASISSTTHAKAPNPPGHGNQAD